jgi:hypothetical protein
METWEYLFDCAMKQVAAAKVPQKMWTFGGGTSLMLKYNHRYSKDIDIFVTSAQLLTYLSPRLTDAIEYEVGRYDELSNFIRIYLDKGEIDFIHSPPITSIEPSLETIRNATIFVDDPVEIIAKKVFYRSEEFKSRDVFDLAVVYSKHKEEVLRATEFFSPHLEKLFCRVDSLVAAGQLDRECSELRLLAYGKQLRGQEAAIFTSFQNDIKNELSRMAAAQSELRAFLEVTIEEAGIAEAAGLKFDVSSGSWYIHRDLLFEMPEKWGGKASSEEFFEKMRVQMKNSKRYEQGGR